MYFIRKWIDAIIRLLQRIYASLQGIWKGLYVIRKGSPKRDKPAPEKKPSPFAAWLKGLGGVFPRGYLLLIGSYLFVITLLVVILVNRQGKVSFLDLPGQHELPQQLESEQEPGLMTGETGGRASPGFFPAPDETDERAEGRGDCHENYGEDCTMEETDETDDAGIKTGAETGPRPDKSSIEKMPAETKDALTEEKNAPDETENASETEDTSAKTPLQETEAGEETGEDAVKETGEETGEEGNGRLLPQAVSPVPKWELYQAFGEYTSESLPSGGKLHRHARGTTLSAAPGAPVAALWDGRVSKTGTSGSPCGRYVIVEHDAGYTTFYGNLREVWVQEGSSIYRGEHLGLLPHFPPGGTSLPATSAPSSPGKSGAVSLKTIWKGIPGDSAVGASVWQYDAGSPLLYLEIRQGDNFLDPLSFIGIRN